MLFSVITPTRDRPDMVLAAIESVRAQTHQEWEQIVYDVGDTPFGPPPSDPRIRYVRGECRGPAADFQAALDLARGDVITPLSDDDRLPRHALATVRREIGDHEWLNGRTVLVNEDGEPVAFRGGTFAHVDDTRHGRYMLGGAVYWKRSLTDRLGGFDSAFDGAADFDLYTRFLNDSDPKLVQDVLYIYTDHPGTDTRVNAARQADASQRIAAAL